MGQTIMGASGADTLFGTNVDDTLAGGLGDDVYLLINGGELFIEMPDEGNDTVLVEIPGRNYSMEYNIENAQLMVSSAYPVSISGNPQDNHLIANQSGAVLYGSVFPEDKSRDTLDGGAGNDSLFGGGGDDVIRVGRGIDEVWGGTGNDTLYVLDQFENYQGTRLDDTIELVNAKSGERIRLHEVESVVFADITLSKAELEARYAIAENHLLNGTSESDTLISGLGWDSLAGAAGDDVYYVNSDKTTVVELTAQGTDRVDTSLFKYTLNANVENLRFIGGLSGFIGNGNELDNKIEGSRSPDKLNGGAGNDTLVGNNSGGFGEVDLIDGGSGTDVVVLQGNYADYIGTRFADGSFDLINLKIGDGVTIRNIEQVAFADVTMSIAAVSSNIASDGNDVLTDLGGRDSLDGGLGADTLKGGQGDDLYFIDNPGDVVIEQAGEGHDTVRVKITPSGGKVATYTLAANVEDGEVDSRYEGAINLTGNDLDNYLNGNYGAANLLTGGAGNDTLSGNGGADTLVGGVGNDTYRVFDNKTTVIENAGQGTDTVLTRVSSYTLGANLENLSFDGDDYADFVGGGNSLDNVMKGSLGNDTLSGGAGNDTFQGLSGTDQIDGGTGLDTVILDGAYADWTATRPTVDVFVLTKLPLDSSAGEPVQVRLTNVEFVKFNDGQKSLAEVMANVPTVFNDTLEGTDGNDTLDGGVGNDSLIGGKGDDVYFVGDSGDVVSEQPGEGTDTVKTTLSNYTLGANVENLAYVGSMAFTGSGNALANVITGGGSGNKLDGGAGNDSVNGGSGNDSISGGSGDDLLSVGIGKDTVDGGDGVDTLLLSQSFASYAVKRISNADTMLTDASGNVVTLRNIEVVSFNGDNKNMNALWGNYPTALNDSILGSNGADTLDGGAGSDTLTGGLGDDTYVVDNVADVVVENSGEGNDLVRVALTTAGTYSMGDNVENASVTAAATLAVNVTGNALDNLIIGNAAANTLAGGAGNDTLDGGAGADKLNGGLGNDLYIVADAGDVVTENQGEGSDTVQTGLASYALTANVENLQYTGSAAFAGTGNALDNVITGGNAGNKLDGGAGNDSLVGGSGNDSLVGGSGNDTFSGLGGNDTIDGGDGADVLQGLGKFSDYSVSRPTATDTVLTDQAGKQITVRGVETLAFSDGSKALAEVQFNVASVTNDSLRGTDGADSLDGGVGNDTLVGGEGDDIYVVDNPNDVVQELGIGDHDVTQVAFTAAGTYQLAFWVEDGIVTSPGTLAVGISGNEMDNRLTGNAGANTLSGGRGNDTLDGGAGADKLIGGVDDDVYIVDNSGDTVTENLWEGWDTVRTSLAKYTLGANVEELRYTGTGAFTGTGNADANVLAGGADADSLAGGGGNDTFTGTAGKDTVDGGADVDTLRLSGNFADYTITRTSITDTVLTDKAGNAVTARNVEWFSFADGDQSLAAIQYNIASPFNDSLAGTSGDDVLNGLAGADTMSGGLGRDTYVVDNVGDVVIESDIWNSDIDTVQVALASAGTYVMVSYVENATVTAAATVAVNVTGNFSNNLIIGNAAANTLSGDSGNDTLDGGAGSDKLIGGLGDDLFVVSDAGDVVTELLDQGQDTVQVAIASYAMTANVEDLEYTGAGAFSGTGNQLNNVMRGGNGGAKLDGGAGNDTLSGGSGNDSLQGGAGNDRLLAFGGKDSVDGGAGNDVLILGGKVADYTVSRASASDTVLTDKDGNAVMVRNVEVLAFADGNKTPDQILLNVISNYSDAVTGSSGNDTLNGLAGADSMSGGGGNDTYVVDDLGDVVSEGEFPYDAGGIDTVQVALKVAGTYALTSYVENATITAAPTVAVSISGNGWNNNIIGNAAANTLDGFWGNDTLDGGAGNDKLVGGTGDDVFVVRDAGDVVLELLDEGHDTVQATIASYTLAANVEDLAFTGSGAFTGIGNALDNVIQGGNGGAKLDGGAGNDTVYGGSGNDSLQGGIGDDVLFAGTGKDTIDGGAGYDTLAGLGNRDDYTVTRPNATDVVLTDKAGNVLTLHLNVEWLKFADGIDVLNNVLINIPSVGDDVLFGTDGKDTLDGGTGADYMNGGSGDDSYVVDNLKDVVAEDPAGGKDTVLVALTVAGVTYKLGTNIENATIISTAAVNLTGNDDENLLIGNAAANTLTGGGGWDTLDGGAGSDKLVGGLGNDLYILNDADTVTELQDEGNDTVQTTLASYALTANVEELAYTGSGFFSGTGNALSNQIQGGNGGNKLDGGAGDDVLRGGTGNDSLLGGAGNDYLFSNGGSDTIDGGAGEDRADLQWLTSKQVTVTRPTATDTVVSDAAGHSVTLRNIEEVQFSDIRLSIEDLQYNVASPGSEHLYGSADNDTMNGGGGADTLEGYGGDDTYVITDKATVIIEHEGAGEGVDLVKVAFTAAATYVLTPYVENAVVTAAASVAVNLTGNELDNWLVGNAAANILTGGLGDDTLDGGTGADKMSGGEGDDLYIVSDSGDTVAELAGQGFDTVRTSLASYTLGANVEMLVYTGSGAFSGTGNAGINVLDGGQYGAKLDGGGGDDYLIGGLGNDSLQGGLGNDVLYASAGKDTLDGGAGNDTLASLDDYGYYNFERLSTGDLRISNSAGDSTVVRNVEWFDFNGVSKSLDQLLSNSVGSGSDTVLGSSGNDLLDGGAGDDRLVGGAGDDLYILSAPGDQVVELEGEGVDGVKLAFSAAGTYTLAENVEHALVSNDSTLAVNIVGNSLDNSLGGNGGANNLSGGAGNDTVNGGAGDDVLTGGAGADHFVFDSLKGMDTVKDFTSGVDLLEIRLPVGNGDHLVDGGLLRAAKGGFSADAELVLFSQKMATVSNANAAAAIGSASADYAIGDSALFAVATTANTTVLFRFVSADKNAVVSAAELTQIAVITGTPTLDDFIFT